MKMKCLYKSILRGDIVKPGQVLDLTDDECKMDVVKKFFVKVDAASGAPAPVAAVTSAVTKNIVVAGLTREEAIMKLQQAGVRVKGNVSNQVLINLYNQTFANVAEATTPAK